MGATSHIAKGLIDRWIGLGEDDLYLFGRSPQRIGAFLTRIGPPGKKPAAVCADYRSFSTPSYDIIVNCVGAGTGRRENFHFSEYFTVTERFDDLAIDYLQHRNPQAIYISFSSGAVYGGDYFTPPGENSVHSLRVNHVSPEDYYGIVRINAEAKHRAHCHLNIVDLRIFSYFSRYINLTDGYFITDVLQSIRNGKVLLTDTSDFVRDYLHPDDLFQMVRKCVRAEKINLAFDVSSSRPVTKQEILDYFASTYCLQYEKRDCFETSSATGKKLQYYSTWHRASQAGYRPQFSSMDTLRDEATYLLPNNSFDEGRRCLNR